MEVGAAKEDGDEDEEDAPDEGDKKEAEKQVQEFALGTLTTLPLLRRRELLKLKLRRRETCPK